MKLNVNLFKQSGKWAYGGEVEVSEQNHFWTDAFKREVLDNQDFVVRGAFLDHIIVITHRDDYDTDPSLYFAQACYPNGWPACVVCPA